MFLIQKGAVAIRKTRGSAAVEIARIYPNEVIGELAFFDRKTRSASAVAINDVDALEISFESLDKIYGGIPDYMKTIIASVVDRLRRTSDQLKRLQKTEVPQDEKPQDLNEDSLDAAAALAATALTPQLEPVPGAVSTPKKSDPKD